MNAKKQSKTKSLLKPTALTTLIAFVLVGCSGGSSEGDQVPTFTSPRSSSNLTDTTNTPINTSNGVEDTATDDTTTDDTTVADDLTNQELLDAFEAQLNKVKSDVKDNGDDLDTLKIGGLIGALALGATSIIGDRINHKNDDKNREEVLGKVDSRADTTDQGVEKYGKANALLNTAGLKVAAQGVAQGQKNEKKIAEVDGNIAAARTDVAAGFSSASEERAENQAEIIVAQRAAAKQALEITEALAVAAKIQTAMSSKIDSYKADLAKASTKEEVQEVRDSVDELNIQIALVIANQAQALAATSQAEMGPFPDGTDTEQNPNMTSSEPAAMEDSSEIDNADFRNSGS